MDNKPNTSPNREMNTPLTPDEALTRLLEGNQRFIKGIDLPDNFGSQEDALKTSQNPYACILGCADSRVSPEHCFDESNGNLFITRVAGNFVSMEILASLEYGCSVLGTPLILVLGHSQCGAISAAVKSHQHGEEYPGHINILTTALAPAVAAAASEQPADLKDLAMRKNVLSNVHRLRESRPILRGLIESGRLRIEGGIYHLDTGTVEILND